MKGRTKAEKSLADARRDKAARALDALRAACEDARPDVIVHLAAQAIALGDADLVHQTQARFAARGIAAERINGLVRVFEGWLDPKQINHIK